jgi:hypothetical protein
MNRWTTSHTFALIVIVATMPVAAIMLSTHEHALLAWLSTMALMFGFLIVTGYGVMGRPLGIFIDERNVVSLSRFQLVIWTVVVLSSFFSAVLWNIAWGHDFPSAVSIPTQLWLLMGIGTTSLVGSPLLLSNKKKTTPDHHEFETTKTNLAKQGDPEGSVQNKGQLVVNTDSANARLSDMFTGEETGNAAHLDVSRIQMFFFTLIVVLTYCVTVGKMFASVIDTNFESLPELDQSITALLGISHVGYLVSKGSSHSL